MIPLRFCLVFALVHYGSCWNVHWQYKRDNISEHPYLTLISLDGRSCNGAIISSFQILTSASCILGSTTDKVKYILGPQQYQRRPRDEDKKKLNFIASLYNSYIYERDLSVLYVKEPFLFENSSVQPISLYQDETELVPGTIINTVEWDRRLDEPITVPVKIIDFQDCDNIYQFPSFIRKSEIFCVIKEDCALDNSGRVIDGILAIHNGELYGILSWGLTCPTKDFPAVFTRIAPNYNLIKNTILLL